MRDINSEEIRSIYTENADTEFVGFPVQIRSYSLYYDYRYNRVFAEAVFVNKTDKPIKKVYVSVSSYDEAGDLAGVTENVPVDFLVSGTDDRVCTDNEIILNYINTSKAEICLIKVVFEDGDVWRRPENVEAVTAENEVRAEQTAEVNEVEAEQTAEPDHPIIEAVPEIPTAVIPEPEPEKTEEKATVNAAQTGIVSVPVKKATAPKTARAKPAAKPAGKGAQSKRPSKKKVKKKDGGNSAAWTIAIIMLSAAIVTVITASIIVSLTNGGGTDNNSKYEQAGEYYENGEYTNAVRLYRSLGDYLDSAEKAEEISVSLTGIPDAVFMTSDKFPCYSIDENGVLSFDSTHYNFPSGIADLPDVFDDKPVRALKNGFFSNCTWLTEVKIPVTVTVLPQKAFYLCASLTKVTLPEGIKQIGNEAFFGCSSLESVELPSTVGVLGNGIFHGCTSLKEITIPSGVTEIGTNEFEDCKSLASVKFEGNILKINNYAFCNCQSLEEIAFGIKLKSIGFKAFAYCTKLTTVRYGGSAEQWSAVAVDSENSPLLNANFIYN